MDNKSVDQQMNSETNKSINIAKKAFTGFKWLAFGKLFGQFLNWGITLFVIRLLSPFDYGLMAIASLSIAVLSLFNEFGLGASIIQAKEINQEILQKIFAIVIMINLILFFILFFIAPFIASFYKELQLIPILRLLSFQFLIMVFSIIPQSLLEKNMKFKERSIIELAANLSGGIVSLWLAFIGKGVWALVWSSLILCLVRTIGLNVFFPFSHFPIFSFKGMKNYISFGGLVFSERILWYLYSQADVFIIGKILGTELLGFYTVGKHLSSLIAEKISPIINQVAFPAFSLIQDQKNEIKQYTLYGISVVSFFAFPIFFGISCVASELVFVVLGEQWLQTIPVIKWRSLVVPLGMISGIIASVLKGIGKAKISLRNIMVACIIMPSAFALGCEWGIVGVSIAWLIARPIHLLLVLFLSLSFIGPRIKDVLFEMLTPFLVSCTMYLAVVSLRHIPVVEALNPFLTLAVLSIFGALFYVLLIFFCAGKKIKNFFLGKIDYDQN